MTVSATPLAALRRQIDDIDGAIHDLLMRRAAVAGEVARAKDGGPAWRPAREAQVLRRLAGRHAGPLPLETVMQIWREIVSAMTRLQGDFAVAVHAPAGAGACRELARDHFGRGAAVSAFASAGEVADAVASGAAAVGVVEAPHRPAAWAGLFAAARTAAVCAELPFVRGPDDRGRAFCLARTDPEESGDDRSLVALSSAGEIAGDEIEAALAAGGTGRWRVAGACADGDGHRHFVECDGFVAAGDAGLGRLAADRWGAAVVRLGAWPAPLAVAAGAGRERAP